MQYAIQKAIQWAIQSDLRKKSTVAGFARSALDIYIYTYIYIYIYDTSVRPQTAVFQEHIMEHAKAVIMEKASGRHLEASGEHLGGIWKYLGASGRHLGGIWEASGDISAIWKHLGSTWKHLETSWRHMQASRRIWKASGRHLGGIWSIWEATGKHLVASGASGRHLGGIWWLWAGWLGWLTEIPVLTSKKQVIHLFFMVFHQKPPKNHGVFLSFLETSKCSF
jgi:hypothetical protein